MAKKTKVVGKACHKVTGLGFPIQLRQESVGKFTVVYGKQVRVGLSYAQAAAEYGAAIMHALASQGLLNAGGR